VVERGGIEPLLLTVNSRELPSHAPPYKARACCLNVGYCQVYKRTTILQCTCEKGVACGIPLIYNDVGCQFKRVLPGNRTPLLAGFLDSENLLDECDALVLYEGVTQ
jgi:hypothetical protein